MLLPPRLSALVSLVGQCILPGLLVNKHVASRAPAALLLHGGKRNRPGQSNRTFESLGLFLCQSRLP